MHCANSLAALLCLLQVLLAAEHERSSEDPEQCRRPQRLVRMSGFFGSTAGLLRSPALPSCPARGTQPLTVCMAKKKGEALQAVWPDLRPPAQTG